MFLWILSPWKFPSKLPRRCKCEAWTRARLCRQHFWLHVTPVSVLHVGICISDLLVACQSAAQLTFMSFYIPPLAAGCWLLVLSVVNATELNLDKCRGPSSAATVRDKRDCVSNSSEFFPGSPETYKQANKQSRHIATVSRATLVAAPKQRA